MAQQAACDGKGKVHAFEGKAGLTSYSRRLRPTNSYLIPTVYLNDLEQTGPGEAGSRLPYIKKEETVMRPRLFVRPVYPTASLLSLLLLLTVWLTKQQGEDITITITGTERVEADGNAHVNPSITFNPPCGYGRMRRLYPNLYVPFRDLGNTRSNYEINRGSLKVAPDDGQRSISLSADLLGAAVSSGSRWQISLSPNGEKS